MKIFLLVVWPGPPLCEILSTWALAVTNTRSGFSGCTVYFHIWIKLAIHDFLLGRKQCLILRDAKNSLQMVRCAKFKPFFLSIDEFFGWYQNVVSSNFLAENCTWHHVVFCLCSTSCAFNFLNVSVYVNNIPRKKILFLLYAIFQSHRFTGMLFLPGPWNCLAK